MTTSNLIIQVHWPCTPHHIHSQGFWHPEILLGGGGDEKYSNILAPLYMKLKHVEVCSFGKWLSSHLSVYRSAGFLQKYVPHKGGRAALASLGLCCLLVVVGVDSVGAVSSILGQMGIHLPWKSSSGVSFPSSSDPRRRLFRLCSSGRRWHQSWLTRGWWCDLKLI